MKRMKRVVYRRRDGCPPGCYDVHLDGFTVSYIERLDTPVVKVGELYRWRGFWDGKWLYFRRRRDIEPYLTAKRKETLS